jgi:hypothetical protein
MPPGQRSRPLVRSTIALCILYIESLRLEGIPDAYEPGTLLDRAYRRNPLACDDDGSADCVFELALHDAPATRKELDDIQSFLDEDTVLAGDSQ